MRDVRADLSNLWRVAAQLPSRGGARAIMFVAANPGEGATSFAASFALIAAARSPKATWLVDVDFMRNAAFAGFQKRFAKGVGQPGRAYDASLGQPPVYRITPEHGPADGGKLLTVNQIEGTRLLVTRFRHEHLQPGQRADLRHQPDWWGALRQSSDWIIVDAPSYAQSSVALDLVSLVDGVVIVVDAEKSPAADVAALRLEIAARGGNILGVAMNNMQRDALLASRLSA